VGPFTVIQKRILGLNTLIPPEFYVSEHIHEDVFRIEISSEYIPVVLFGMIGVPIKWYLARRNKEVIA